MSTLGLTPHLKVPPIRLRRFHHAVPNHMIKKVGRQGLNMYRMVHGNTIQDIARLFHRSQEEVYQVMHLFQREGYIQMEFPEDMDAMEKIASIPTMLILYSDLGLANQ